MGVDAAGGGQHCTAPRRIAPCSAAPCSAAAPRRVRDLLVLDRGEAGAGGELLVLACDSAGGAGPKPLDGVKVPARVVGLFTARVALMEVIAAGAAPVAVTATICCEPEPTGSGVACGVMEEMAAAGLGPEALVISTEKNLGTAQTGVGVTVLGTVRRGRFLPGRALPGDIIALVGHPKVGAEVAEDDPAIVDLHTVTAIIRSGLAADLVPVGSRGAAAEARELASSAGLVARLCPEQDGSGGGLLSRSGGPATALVAAVRPDAVAELARVVLPRPCRVIGWLAAAAGQDLEPANSEPSDPGPREA